MKLSRRLFVPLALLVFSSLAWSADQALLQRGKYLVEGIVACGNCHMARGPDGAPQPDKGLSGGMLFDDPAFKAYAPNITPDRETGIGRWSDARLRRAIREGLRHGEPVIGPPMPIPFYRHLSDRDLSAIIAYLRAQPPVRHQVPPSHYNIPLPAAYGPPLRKVVAPSRKDPVAYGGYLVAIGHCMDCHTPRDAQGQLQLERMGAGGQVFKGPWGESVSRNLTPDASGLRDWSDAQIARAIREGIDRDGHPLRPPMGFAFYQHIDDADMAAMVAYLRSLKPLATQP